MKPIILLFFTSFILRAGMSSEIIVEGRVSNFDAKNVTLVHQNGHKALVPRSAIPKMFTIREGNYVRAIMKSDFLLKEIARVQKKAKK